jgi:hypothetical protein
MKLCANKDFNVDGRNRRSYQLPTDKDENGRFVLATPLFVRRNAFNRSKPTALRYTPHNWVADAVKDNRRWMPNPERARLLVFKDESLGNLTDDSEPTLTAGDVIWMSFTLTFSIGSMYWAPEYRPIELIRVGRLSRPEGSRVGIETLDVNDDERKPLETGTRLQLPIRQLMVFLVY